MHINRARGSLKLAGSTNNLLDVICFIFSPTETTFSTSEGQGIELVAIGEGAYNFPKTDPLCRVNDEHTSWARSGHSSESTLNRQPERSAVLKSL